MVLAAAVSGLEVEFVNGVVGADMDPKTYHLEGGGRDLSPPELGIWRAHLNVYREIVRRGIKSALVMEDDVDWDINIRTQHRQLARASRALTQPLAGAPGRFADPTFPPAPGRHEGPVAEESLPGELRLEHLPATVEPVGSPYGDNWDVLWTGWSGMAFPGLELKLPKGRVVWSDHTVPGKDALYNMYWEPHIAEQQPPGPKNYKEKYPDHTRVVHHQSK